MRKFLLLLAFLTWPVWADDSAVREGLQAFRAPMQQMVREAAKGRGADMAAMGKSYAEAKTAWMRVTAEQLDLDRFGVPKDQQDEVWRQVRTVGLLMGYLDEAVRREDRTLAVRSAGLLPPAYDKVAAALGVR